MTLQPHDPLFNQYRSERLPGEGAFAQVCLAILDQGLPRLGP
jgi:hypothetical protein